GEGEGAGELDRPETRHHPAGPLGRRVPLPGPATVAQHPGDVSAGPDQVRAADSRCLPARRHPPDEIENWLNDEIEGGIAPSSVHRHYRTLRRVLQVAVEKQKMV